MRHILEHTAAWFNVPARDLIDHSRFPHIVRARHVCYFIMRKRFGMTYPQIGHIMRRDHSSIIYAYDKILWLQGDDEQIGAAVAHLMEVPCTRFIPSWLKNYTPDRQDADMPIIKPQAPCATEYTEALPYARAVTISIMPVKAKNDFDSELAPGSFEATSRRAIRAGSDALLAALQAA